MKKLPPFTEWVKKCQLGVRDEWSAKNNWFWGRYIQGSERLERDPHCVKVMEAVADRGWNEKDANTQVCNGNLPEANEVKYLPVQDGQFPEKSPLFFRCEHFNDEQRKGKHSHWAKFHWDNQVPRRDNIWGRA